jgi:excisionase family DNA binding protein
VAEANPNTNERRGLSRLDLMTPDEVAELLGVTRKRVIEWARRGILPGFKLGKDWRFLRSDIENHLLALSAA